MQVAKKEALQALYPFVGKWQTSGYVIDALGKRIQDIRGTDTYEWLPGHYFLLHIIDVWMGPEHNQSIEIIGYDAVQRHYPMQYYDNMGNEETMNATVNGAIWQITGDTLRFAGSFSENNTRLSGIWEQLDDEGKWVPHIHISLTRYH